MSAEKPVVCLGEALIDLVAVDPDVPFARVRAFAPAVGGAPANVAVGIARLGGRSAFVGRLGDDPFGHAIATELRMNGVDVRIGFEPGARTALAFVATDADGNREFLFYRERSADTLLAPADVEPALIAGASALHVGTVSLSMEPSGAATRHAIQLAADAGVLRSCDLNLRPALWRTTEEMLTAARELVSACDIVKASADEVRTLAGTSDPQEGAEWLVASGARLAIVTCAAEGAAYATRSGSGSVRGWTVQAVDGTGAGDAFVAALLVEIERSHLLREPVADHDLVRAAVRVANAAGALATQRRGAIPALPTRADIDAFVRLDAARPIAG